MASTKINVGAVIGLSSTATGAKTTVTNVKSSFNTTRRQIDGKILNRSNLANRFQNVYNTLGSIETKVSRIKSMVENGANWYHDTDQTVLGWSNDIVGNFYSSSGIVGGAGLAGSALDLFESIGRRKLEDTTGDEVDTRSGFAKFINNELKVKGSVLSDELSGEGEFLGINTAGKIGGAILTGEAGIKSRMSWKFKDDDGNWDFKSWGLSTTASASGAVASGEAEGNLGYLHGKVEGKVLTGAVKGEAKCTIFDDGKLNPSLSLGASAEGSVLQGEAEAGFGTDQYGIYAKADGDVLHAEAEAKAGIGYIGTDKKGNSIYGASAEASAMASVAQGKVKGGITVFGIDIDVGVKGYAVAAGVEAGGSISTNGVKANFSGALGLGAGLDISVDWSDAKWIGDSIDAVGDFVGDATDFIGDAASSVYNAAGDFISGAADVAGDVGDFLFGWIG